MTPRGLQNLTKVARALVLACGASLASAQESPAITWDPWYALLPIDQPGGAANIGEGRPVEDELEKQFPGKDGPDLTRVHQGKNSVPVTWVSGVEEALAGSIPELGAIDFAKLMPPNVPVNDASAYLYRRIRAISAATVTVKYGYDDAARVWFNGKLVSESSRTGVFEPFADSVTLDLVPGDNHLFVKVTNSGGAWKFRLTTLSEKPLVGRAAAQEKINAAIDDGCAFLISQQLRDGSWAFEDGGFPGGQTALSVYALLKSGVSPKHQAVQRGIAYLRARPALKTYTASCTLLALWALNDPTNAEWIADLADELMSWQRAGEWAYPEGESDLSNSQYAVLGLFAAARCGVKIPPKVWRDAIGQTLHHQGRSGGFGYRIGDSGNPTGSMTVAGLSVIAMARGQLTEDNNKQVQGLDVADQGLADGARWLAEHFTITGSSTDNPKDELNRHRGPYYLYGLERACTLLGMERLAGSDWYWEGATWFLDIQGDKGQFATAYGEAESNTCFALLFLGRATAAFTGKSGAKKDTVYQTDDSKSDVFVRASGDARLALWIGGFSKRAIADYGWTSPQGKAVHVAKVEYWVDGELAETVNGNASKAWDGDKFSLLHTFANAGTRRVKARAYLLLEPETEGGDPLNIEIESTEIEINVREIAAPELITQASVGARNLIRPEDTKTSASSQPTDSLSSAAVDGREATAWTSAPEDGKPTLTLEFERPLRANRLVFSGLGGRPDSIGDWDRATKVELRINKIDPVYSIALDPNELLMTTFEIPRQGVVRSLELKIVERVTGKKFPGRVGFREIGLYFQSASKR